MQVSTRRKVCLWGAQASVPPRRFQAPWMTLFFSPHSGRSRWEEPEERPQSYKAEGPPTPSPSYKNETRCDKLLNPCHSTLLPFLSLPRFRSRSAEEGQKRRERKGRRRRRRGGKKLPPASQLFTISVNPSQLQSVMIRSLINATGKERSKARGSWKTSQYLGLNNTLIELCRSAPLCRRCCRRRCCFAPSVTLLQGCHSQFVHLPRRPFIYSFALPLYFSGAAAHEHTFPATWLSCKGTVASGGRFNLNC